MYTFELWVRLNNLQTAHVRLQADNAMQAKMIGEAQYGRGNVLNYTQING
jgi:hypothetical protein